MSDEQEIGIPIDDPFPELPAGDNDGRPEPPPVENEEEYGVQAPSVTGANTAQSESTIDDIAPAFSDDALADQFSERHAEDLRYVAAWGQWYGWKDCRWQQDDTLAVYDEARNVCRDAAADCNKPRDAKGIASAKTVAAVERLARSDRRHAATIDQWDADPWALNTPAVTVDLRTGELKPHCRSDFITRVTPISPRVGCPTWNQFLDRITDGDDELKSYLQRVVGYAATGITREHALFFGHGLGANGKSVFVDTIAGIFGEYHRTAPMDVFVASNSDRHPTELAMLRGARLVTAVETEEGRRWNESRIKSLTGGDRIAARFMRQDFFEFVPQFKLFVVGNHKPSLRSVDEAIRRRLHLIPFDVTIPLDERDETLATKLRREWPGILAWAIEGSVEWGMTGLQPPERVRKATEMYLSEEDGFKAWCEECCEEDPSAWEKTSELYRSWKSMAERSGEHAGSQKAFSQTLAARGFRWERRTEGRGYFGLRIKRRDYTDDARYGG